MLKLQLTAHGWKGEPEALVDCIIVGGGPAGLTAAIYLSRFLRRCIVIDAGAGRAATIPKTHNLPGFPGGISGVDLLLRMKNQAQRYGATIRHGEVSLIEPSDGGGFTLRTGDDVLRAHTILLATGVINHRPEMPSAEHDGAVARGLIRYCPVCDGYEASRMNIAVLGCDGHGAAEAEFLRTYSQQITLLPQRSTNLSPADQARLIRAGIKVEVAAVLRLKVDRHQIVAELVDGTTHRFDTLYPALGSSPRAQLATMIGSDLSGSGGILINEHQQTSVPGIYAAGDVVEGLDQISVATGQAARAATAIHNYLRDREEALATALGTLEADERRLLRKGTEGRP